jgi:hypothetical protein
MDLISAKDLGWATITRTSDSEVSLLRILDIRNACQGLQITEKRLQRAESAVAKIQLL